MTSSINDLLENLTGEAAAKAPRRPRPEVWRLGFIVPDMARLWRDDGPLLEALVQEGFELHVIGHDPAHVEPRLAARGILTRTLPPCEPLWRGIAALPAIYPLLQGYLIEHPMSLIHVEGEPLLSLTLWASKLLDEAPLLVGSLRGTSRLERELLPEQLPEPLRQLGERAIDGHWGHLSQRLDLMLTTSREELDALHERGRVAPQKLEAWPAGSGYDAERFAMDLPGVPRGELARQMSQLPEAWREVIGVAAHHLSKEEEALLSQVIRRLARERPEVGWALALPEAVAARLARLAPEQVRRVVPGDQGMPIFYGAIDLLVSPRLSARVATTLLEAQAMGVPVVALDAEQTRAVLSGGQSRVDAEYDQSTALFEGVKALLARDAASRRALAEEGATHVSARFTRERAHAQLLALYDRLLSRRYA